jgi:hypothetical protein
MLHFKVPMSMPIGTSGNDCYGLSLNATNTVKFSDATNTASMDAHHDLLHEELNVRTVGNNNDIL